MQSESPSPCIRSFDVQNECLSLVNPYLFTNSLLVYTSLAQQAKTTSISLNAVFVETDGVISQLQDLADNFAQSQMTEDSSTNTCSCSGYLKEIHYVVQVNFVNNSANTSNSYYTIANVNATIVLGNDNIVVTCGESAEI